MSPDEAGPTLRPTRRKGKRLVRSTQLVSVLTAQRTPSRPFRVTILVVGFAMAFSLFPAGASAAFRDDYNDPQTVNSPGTVLPNNAFEGGDGTVSNIGYTLQTLPAGFPSRTAAAPATSARPLGTSSTRTSRAGCRWRSRATRARPHRTRSTPSWPRFRSTERPASRTSPRASVWTTRMPPARIPHLQRCPRGLLHGPGRRFRRRRRSAYEDYYEINFSFLRDTDGDGVFDNSDACRTTSGTLSNGCPAPAARPDRRRRRGVQRRAGQVPHPERPGAGPNADGCLDHAAAGQNRHRGLRRILHNRQLQDHQVLAQGACPRGRGSPRSASARSGEASGAAAGARRSRRRRWPSPRAPIAAGRRRPAS